jgi:TnpA family transposase
LLTGEDDAHRLSYHRGTGTAQPFSQQIPNDDLSGFFLLSEADHRVANKQREDYTRLGFALQLCALRHLGFAPDDLTTTP